MTRVELPWPSSALSPNARTHWRSLAKVKAAYRKACWAVCIAHGVKDLGADALSITLTFCPPDNRRRDIDNLSASMKAGIDGIADATGVDDSTYTITLARGPVRKGGAVLAEIEGVQP